MTCLSVTPAARIASGLTSTWYSRTNPPIDATSLTPSTPESWYLTVKSWIDRSSSGPQPPVALPWESRPSSVYQKTCPSAVASGPSAGVTPGGRVPAERELSFSSRRDRDQ
jgi:hypothetical protein